MAIDKNVEMGTDLLRRIQQHSDMIIELTKLYKQCLNDYLQENSTKTENDFNEECKAQIHIRIDE